MSQPIAYAPSTSEQNLFDALEIPNRYVPAVRVGARVLVAGQVALSADGQALFPGDMRVQTAIALQRVERALASLGGQLSDVVTLNAYYVGTDAWRQALEVRGAFFEHGPVSTGLAVASVHPVAGLVFGIEATAELGDRNTFVLPEEDRVAYGGRVPFTTTGRAGNARWVAGASAHGEHPDDVVAQVDRAFTVLERRLGAVGATLDDVEQLRGFWVETPQLEAALARRDAGFRRTPLTVDVVVPDFPTPGLLVEFDLPALMAEGNGDPGAALVRTGLVLPPRPTADAPGDMAASLERLASELAAYGLGLDDVLHLHWYSTVDGRPWREAATELWSALTTPTAVTPVGITRFPRSVARIGLTAVAARRGPARS